MIIIKSGSLFFLENGSEKEFLSPFAQEKIEAEKKQWEKQSWKAANEPSEDEAIISRTMLWGAKGRSSNPSRPFFLACQKIGQRLYYVLSMSRARGLFYWDIREKKEIRLFHREEFDPHGLCLTPDYSVFTTQRNTDGTSHLIKMNDQGKGTQTITSGDCIDENPFAFHHTLYYQTSGLARTQDGAVVACSPSSIHRVNLANGQGDSIKEHPDWDYLLPKCDQQGVLYFIERPHVKPGHPQGFLEVVKDVVLFPYRLVVAIFGFLNLFSLIFGKKPLLSAGGPDIPEQDLSRRLIHGRIIDITEAAKKEGRKVVVSKDWRLMRRFPDGKEEVIDTNVVWFDVSPVGALRYTDGFRVLDESKKVMHVSEEMIQFVHYPDEPHLS